MILQRGYARQKSNLETALTAVAVYFFSLCPSSSAHNNYTPFQDTVLPAGLQAKSFHLKTVPRLQE